MRPYQSWGRFPPTQAASVVPIYWRSATPALGQLPHTVLPYGQGRSYGDVCLNDGGILLDTAPLARFMAFDAASGLLRCEAGTTLADILNLVVPRGWFLPVTPGTKWVSVGGAIANDVHGKNHHGAGTFGMHITQLELLRSSEERVLCSPSRNVDLFQATIGGLGLTGLILWAEIQLQPISNPLIRMERIRFGTLKEFFQLAQDSDRTFAYTVAWVDCLASGARTGRGLFFRGNHLDEGSAAPTPTRRRKTWTIPFDAPAWLLNHWTIKAFNCAYYRLPLPAHGVDVLHYDPFFYPLDALHDWNRLYGSRGFLQHQCVVPFEGGEEAIRDILRWVAGSGRASFLSVLKLFGDKRSPGMLSFPRPGITLALDLPYDGAPTLRLLSQLDEIVLKAGGAVYPAKDARMSPEHFKMFFPRWVEFSKYTDRRFSSTFWRRVTEGGAAAGP